MPETLNARSRLVVTAALLACGLALGCSGGGGGSSSASLLPPAPLTLTTTTLPDALFGAPYAATLTAAGGTEAGYTWSVVAGALPRGLSLPGAGTPSVTLGGTPTAPGAVTFTVRVEDPDGRSAERGFAIETARRYVVYEANQDQTGVDELYAVDVSGAAPGAAVRLHAPLTTTADITSSTGSDPIYSPDGRRVVYLADANVDGAEELFVVDLAAASLAASAVRVNTALPGAAADVNDWSFSKDGSRLAYNADQDTLGVNELYLVSLAGAAPSSPVKVNQALVSGGQVGVGIGTGHAFHPSGDAIFYLADAIAAGRVELWRAPIGPLGLGTPAAVSGTLVTGSAVKAFTISEDGAWLAFAGDKDTDDVDELYLVDLRGATPSAPVKASGAMIAAGDLVANLGGFGFAPDSKKLVYRADATTDGVLELWYVSLASGAPAAAVRLHGPLPTTAADVNTFLWSQDGRRLAFQGDLDVANRDELYVVDTSGAAPGATQKASGALVSGGSVFSSTTGSGYAFTSDGARLVYRADQATNDVNELFLVDVSGATPTASVRVNAALPTSTADVNSFFISPDGAFVMFNQYRAPGVDLELFAADISGAVPGTPQLASGALATGGGVLSGFVSMQWMPASDRLTFIGDVETVGRQEFFVVARSGGGFGPRMKASGAPAAGVTIDVKSLRVQP